MAIDLSAYEAAPKHDGDYGERLAALQKRLGQIQFAHALHRRRAMIVIEGWEGSGRAGVIRRLTAGWDPRGVRVFAEAAPDTRHWLARHWERVPPAGAIHVFEQSWYARVLGDRVAGRVTRAEWRRAYDAINEFEAQQRDDGTTLVKLFLHITADEQDARLRARLAHPWKRGAIDPAAIAARGDRTAMRAALDEMFAATDTRWAPWHAIDAGHRKHARLAALEHVAAVLGKAVPATPPEADPALLAAAREAGLLAEA